MKSLILTLALIQLLSLSAYSQDYYSQNRFALTSPGAMKYGLYGYNNPAVLANLESPDLVFAWSEEEGIWNDLNNWGLFAGFPGFSVAVINQDFSGRSVTDYKLSAGFGDPSFSVGLGYQWSGDIGTNLARSNVFTLGALIRPNRYLSIGLIGNIKNYDSEGILEAAVRPFGNEWLSIFGDYLYVKDRPDELNIWSAGAAVEALPGVRITGRYFENETFNVGVSLSFGNAGIFAQGAFNEDGKHTQNISGIRLGSYDRNPFSGLSDDDTYIEMNLLGGVKYQKYRFFDNSNTLISLLDQIDAAKDDKAVSGIAINTSGMSINKEMIWELREKLKQFKAAGKHVIIYFDRLDIDGYHLASVADKIVMDPVGSLMLQGYLLGRQYYAGTLDKLGIGFTELRYFKYKSAAETFSRTEMSDADEEQWQAIIDDYYTLAKNDICESRGISHSEFDNIIDNKTLFLPDEAIENNLADTLARWDAVSDLIKQLEGENKSIAGAGSLDEFKLPNDDYWGSKPEIAVIYALGVCAMDQGINARSLVKDVNRAANNNDVKAIVFRVDSPGGDALASDIVAEALKKAKDKKPVIVSQGYVAGSGGYWLSMYGDTIVAAPNTITGSIGVISGWYYNKDFKESAGVSTDYVKRGAHADFGFGMTIPFIGLSLPDRDMTVEEKERAEHSIKVLYDDFVTMVAEGRNMPKEEVQEIAQGRVWSGVDGLSNGLVDVLGGLDTAIKIAEEESGLMGKEYEIVEYPEMPWFNFSSIIPNPFRVMLGLELPEVKPDKTLNNIIFRMQNNGIPMPFIPMDDSYMLDEY